MLWRIYQVFLSSSIPLLLRWRNILKNFYFLIMFWSSSNIKSSSLKAVLKGSCVFFLPLKDKIGRSAAGSVRWQYAPEDGRVFRTCIRLHEHTVLLLLTYSISISPNNDLIKHTSFKDLSYFVQLSSPGPVFGGDDMCLGGFWFGFCHSIYFHLWLAWEMLQPVFSLLHTTWDVGPDCSKVTPSTQILPSLVAAHNNTLPKSSPPSLPTALPSCLSILFRLFSWLSGAVTGSSSFAPLISADLTSPLSPLFPVVCSSLFSVLNHFNCYGALLLDYGGDR